MFACVGKRAVLNLTLAVDDSQDGGGAWRFETVTVHELARRAGSADVRHPGTPVFRCGFRVVAARDIVEGLTEGEHDLHGDLLGLAEAAKYRS